MSTVTFDTQELVQESRSAGMLPEQAEAVVRTIVKSHAELATKTDVKLADVKLAVAELRADIIKWMVGLALAQMALSVGILLKLPH